MIIHSPRVIASIVKGLWKRSPENKYIGFLPGNPPHVYTARAGLFDVDYLGHMNNASSLTHAEYARWEMTATNGALQTMYNTNTHFMVASTAIRFRRQVRPIFRTFQVQTTLGGIDERNFWMYVMHQ
jgi:acyl-CoA thioesterase FadM